MTAHVFRWGLLWLMLMPATAFAQPVVRRVDGSTIDTARLDTIIPRIMKQAGVIGLNIAVLNQVQPVYERVFGLRDREQHLPVTPETVFEAASLVFAYLVMSLVKDGLLKLDTPLHQYLEYKDIAHAPDISWLPPEWCFPIPVDCPVLPVAAGWSLYTPQVTTSTTPPPAFSTSSW